jgi:hypothetical protein
METARTPLINRIAVLLHVKQYLVFFAIGLFALDELAPLLTAWLRHHRTLDDLLSSSGTPIGDLFAKPGVLMVLSVAVYVVVAAYLRAGYLRSLLGRLHLRPQDRLQFGRLFTLLLLIDIITAAQAWAFHAAGSHQGLSSLLVLTVLLVSTVLLYADYAIVVTSATAAGSILRSWRTVRANVAVSILVVLGMYMIDSAAGAILAAAARGSTAQALPLLTLHVVVMGAVSFVSDVILIMTYIDTVERGALPAGRPRD